MVLKRSIVFAMLMATSALGQAHAASTGPRPMFAVIPHLKSNLSSAATTSLPPTWNYSYTYDGTTYTEAFIGTNPSSPASTTVPVYIVPVKMVLGSTTADPLGTLPNGNTVIQNTIASPIFQDYPFKFAATAIGKTQYIDAFQKVNLWNIGGKSKAYHTLLAQPTVLAEQTITVPATQGGLVSAFGVSAIGANINWIDKKFQALITSLKIPAQALPLFVTTQTYLLESPSTSQCCIGGYHSVNSTGQPYAHFTYIQKLNAFSQDVSALSHEIGEWLDDPYTNNNSPCGIFEVGDPLEADANYGDYLYKLNGFTYHLQDLALLPYFGDTSGATLKGLDTMKQTVLSVCQNGS